MFEDDVSSARSRSGKETVLLLLSTIVAAAITPLAYIRLREEHWKLAFVNAGMVSIMLLLFLFVFVSVCCT